MSSNLTPPTAAVVQLAEHRFVVPNVVGSIPIGRLSSPCGVTASTVVLQTTDSGSTPDTGSEHSSNG